MTARRVGIVIAAVAAAVIAVATLTPGTVAANPGSYDPRCRICGPLTGVDVIGNLLLFIPLGIGLAVAGVARSKVATIGAIASISIELMQIVIPGRDPSIIDVISNTLGAFTGAVFGAHWRLFVLPTKRESTVLAVGSGAVYIAIVAFVSWALGPSLPDTSWYLERAIGTKLRPTGHVIDARASNEPMIGDTLTNVPTVRRDLLDGKRVSVTAEIAPGSTQATSFIQILSTSLDDIVTIDRRHDDAAFFSRMRGSDVRLQRIGVRLPGFFTAASKPDTVKLSGARVGASLELEGERNGHTSSTSLALTPSLGWAFFVPMRDGITGSMAIAGFAWTVLLVLPFAYWAACAARMAPSALRWHLTRVVVVAAATGLVPILFSVGPGHWWEWIAGGVGLLLGQIVGLVQKPTREVGD